MYELILLLTLCGQPIGMINHYPADEQGIRVDVLPNTSASYKYLQPKVGADTYSGKVEIGPLIGAPCEKV